MEYKGLPEERSAFIAIVGRPNVGKSSLLNRLVGEKIAIVSRKPQTTRTRIMGVLTQGEDQLVFLDTPGLIKAKNSLGEYMVKSVTRTVDGVDACLLVTEAGALFPKRMRNSSAAFRAGRSPRCWLSIRLTCWRTRASSWIRSPSMQGGMISRRLCPSPPGMAAAWRTFSLS